MTIKRYKPSLIVCDEKDCTAVACMEESKEGEWYERKELRELLEKEHRKIYERYIYTKKKSNEQMYNGQMALITKLLAELEQPCLQKSVDEETKLTAYEEMRRREWEKAGRRERSL